jgi:hypothetical protein
LEPGRLPSAVGTTFHHWEESMIKAGRAAAVAPLVDLDRTVGYLVADVRGRVVGRVEAPACSGLEGAADALSVRAGALRRRRRLVPAGAIAAVDERTRVVGLRVERRAVHVLL